MRDQPNSSAAQRPPLTQSNSPVKWSASRSRNASGEAIPSRANAKIVFFWVSVATTWALSPSVCGVGVRAEQQRHVVVTLAGNHGEFHGHAREEGVSLGSCKVDTGGEADPVVAGIQHVRPKITDAAV